jgi:hypothetical protein
MPRVEGLVARELSFVPKTRMDRDRGEGGRGEEGGGAREGGMRNNV